MNRLGSPLQPQSRTTGSVLQTDGPLLILAGAGSGKTRVIAHRIAHLVSERRRLARIASSPSPSPTRRRRRCGRASRRCCGVDCRQMWISTFHALCARLLRREAPHIGLSRDFVIYDSTDQLTVIKQALRELGHGRRIAGSRGWRSRASATRRTGWRGRSLHRERVEPARSADWQAVRTVPEGAEGRRTRSTSTICCSRRWSCSRSRKRCATATARSSAT